MHLAERMDDGFLKLSQRMDDKSDEVKKDFARQTKDADDRQRQNKHFWIGTLIAVIACAGTLAGVIQRFLSN